MTENETIEIIKNFPKWNLDDLWLENDKMDELVDVAIKALEKQIPKKPDFTEDKEFALCPCCNGKGLLNKQKYCDNCGQKIDLDWSDEE